MQQLKTKTKLPLLVFAFALSAFSALPITLLAYTETTTGGQLSAEVSPDTPEPFSQIYIKLVSYQVDLGRSNISWAMNGAKKQAGIGLADITLSVGDAGKKSTIDVDVQSQDGVQIKKTISIIPGGVDLLWQSNGLVPPLYRGKALAVSGNQIKLVAMPNIVTEAGARVDPSKLVYNWKANGNFLPSGYGKSSVTAVMDSSYLQNTFSVDASSLDGNLRATKYIKLYAASPNLLFYKSAPLSGTDYSAAIGPAVDMGNNELTIVAVPYFASGGVPGLNYNWSLNGKPAVPSTGSNTNAITLRHPSSSSGTATLGLEITGSPQSPLNNYLNIMFNPTSSNF